MLGIGPACRKERSVRMYGPRRVGKGYSRWVTNASETFSPRCACPRRRMATPTPLRVRTPLLSSSARLHISARTVGESLEPLNILTAASPVMTPSFWVSAWAKIWLMSATSWGVGVNLDMANKLEGAHALARAAGAGRVQVGADVHQRLSDEPQSRGKTRVRRALGPDELACSLAPIGALARPFVDLSCRPRDALVSSLDRCSVWRVHI